MPASAEALEFRRQIGLATDRPIVMSGHQSGFWHAGIVAKVFALDAAAARFKAGSAWVVVDQDVGEPGRVAYPVRRRGAGADGVENLGRAVADLLPVAPVGVVTGRQAASRARVVEVEKGAVPGVAEGMARIAVALDRHAGAESAAMQVTKAAMDLITGPDGVGYRGPSVRPPVLVSALSLARTEVFAELLDLMRRDPLACATQYNEAVAAHPDARLRQLRTHSRRGPELPLWVMTPGGTRETAFAEDLDLPAGGAASPTLAPRALLMTAILRWVGCDQFIHGLGGGRYDKVMEQWFSTWRDMRHLAYAFVVSATKLMELVDRPPPTPEAVARARWAAHHALHNPSSAEELAGKREMAAAIRHARGPERDRLFRAMHEWLARSRARRAGELDALAARAAALEAGAGTSGIVFDRTWAFEFLPRHAKESVRTDVRGRFLPRGIHGDDDAPGPSDGTPDFSS